MPAPLDTSRKPKATKADKELLFKGVTLALIGLVILLAPYVARSTSVREREWNNCGSSWSSAAMVASSST